MVGAEGVEVAGAAVGVIVKSGVMVVVGELVIVGLGDEAGTVGVGEGVLVGVAAGFTSSQLCGNPDESKTKFILV